MKAKKGILSNRIFVLIILLVISIAAFSVAVPGGAYINPVNLLNILKTAVIPVIFGFGMGIIIAGGGFDLSLGHIGSLAALLIAIFLRDIHLNLYFALVLVIVIGAVIGALSGLIVTRLGISSFVATLAMQFIIIGIRKMVTTNGGQVSIPDNKRYHVFRAMATGTVGPVPVIVIVMIVVAVICWIIMEKLTLGRKIAFVRENIEASRYSGINIRFCTFITFVLGGAIAAFGGMMFISRNGSANLNSVDGRLLDAITISVLSNVIIGKFSTIGIICAGMLVYSISTGMSMLGYQSEWIEVAKGAILLAVIIVGSLTSNTKRAKKSVPQKPEAGGEAA